MKLQLESYLQIVLIRGSTHRRTAEAKQAWSFTTDTEV